MCRCLPSVACAGCGHAISRRGFLGRSGAAALAAGTLGASAAWAEEPAKQAKVAMVFVGDSRGTEIWPYPGYDCETRRQEILKALREGCPQVEFEPVLVNTQADFAKVAAMKDSVDGFLVYTLCLQWGLTGSVVQIGKLGKPTLVADEYLGGSGVFLIAASGLHRQNVPFAAVSTTRLDDLVAVARQFAEVKKPGVTPATFAAACDETYRRLLAKPNDAPCVADPLRVNEISECLKRFKESRFVVVGVGHAKSGEERDFLGAKGIYVGFEELRALYDKVDRDQAAHWADRWTSRAEKVMEAKPEWIQKAAAVYLATLELMKKYGTDSVTMNCLGGFSSGQLPAYPCLGFMQILDDGGQGVCEAMPEDSVSMIMARILTGRAGYVSDPALDTSKNQIVYSHCMAHTKVFGPQGTTNKFRIRTLHNRDPRGCCAESFLPEGYLTTTFRVSIGGRKLVLHQAKSVGNLSADRGCRTQLLGDVRGDIEKLFHQWDHFGWHRVTVYGDIKEPLVEFAKALNLQVVEEA
jgi:hypothetical protein